VARASVAPANCAPPPDGTQDPPCGGGGGAGGPLPSVSMLVRVKRAGDVMLAAAAGIAALVEIAVAHGSASGWYGPMWLDVLVALAFSVPLAFRVRAPLRVLVVVLAASAVAVSLAGRHQGPFEAFAALLIAAYTVGAHVGGRRERLGLVCVVLPVGIGAIISVALPSETPGNAFPTVVAMFGCWFVGRVIRRWRERAEELERLTRLEAEAAVAVERGRIARELHDVIAHNVSMIVVQAAAAARVLRGDEPDVRAALDAIETTGRETVDEMRRMLGVVRAPDDAGALAPQPTLCDVERLVASVREAGLPVDLRIEGEPVALPPGVDLSAFRIVQEALTNALKHAGDAHATVTLRYTGSTVEVEVVDDGDGSDGPGTGHGLIGMRERVALWGGELEARRRDEGGFIVRATLPAVT
jgi:signal transduction histidine kinase